MGERRKVNADISVNEKEKGYEKLITVLLAGVMTLSLAACGGTGAEKPADTQAGGNTKVEETAAASPGKAQFYSFGAGGSGGTWYTMVGGIISLFNDNIPNSSFSVSATGGSGENATRLYSGDDDFGMVYDTHIYQAYSGTGDLKANRTITFRFFAKSMTAATIL